MLIHLLFSGLAVQATAAPPPPPPAVVARPAPPAPAYRRLFVDWSRLERDARAAEAAPPPGAPRSAASAADLGARVGQMVATGDCRGGEQIALDAGDLALARAVRRHCNGR